MKELIESDKNSEKIISELTEEIEGVTDQLIRQAKKRFDSSLTVKKIDDKSFEVLGKKKSKMVFKDGAGGNYTQHTVTIFNKDGNKEDEFYPSSAHNALKQMDHHSQEYLM